MRSRWSPSLRHLWPWRKTGRCPGGAGYGRTAGPARRHTDPAVDPGQQLEYFDLHCMHFADDGPVLGSRLARLKHNPGRRFLHFHRSEWNLRRQGRGLRTQRTRHPFRGLDPADDLVVRALDTARPLRARAAERPGPVWVLADFVAAWIQLSTACRCGSRTRHRPADTSVGTHRTESREAARAWTGTDRPGNARTHPSAPSRPSQPPVPGGTRWA